MLSRITGSRSVPRITSQIHLGVCDDTTKAKYLPAIRQGINSAS